jgi:hypothetical protein
MTLLSRQLRVCTQTEEFGRAPAGLNDRGEARWASVNISCFESFDAIASFSGKRRYYCDAKRLLY